MRYLITAGGTREYLDPVRFIANASSGKMGYALARAALRAGHDVTLVTAPTHLRPPERAEVVAVISARDLLVAVQKGLPACDVLIMAAAVADYTVNDPTAHKRKKGEGTWTLPLEPTVDVLQWAGAEAQRRAAGGRPRPRIVGFALEDTDLRPRAEAKLRDKHLDLIVANTPAAIGADTVELQVLAAGSPWQVLAQASKSTQARRLIRLIDSLRH